MLRALCLQTCTAPVAAMQCSKKGWRAHGRRDMPRDTWPLGHRVTWWLQLALEPPVLASLVHPVSALSHQLRECGAGDHLHAWQLVNLLGEGVLVLGLCPALPVAAAEPLLPPWLPTAPVQQYRATHRAAPTCSTAHQRLHIVPARTNCAWGWSLPCPVPVPWPCLVLLASPDPPSQERAASESLRGTWEVDAARDTDPELSQGHLKSQSKLVAGAQPAAWLPWFHGVHWGSRALSWLPLPWCIHCKYLLQYIFI